MKYKVFIDGSEGTTGLEIGQRLAERPDLERLEIPENERKDPEARKALLNAADVAFLCLPDAAALESAALVENSRTVVIDTSCAHRTAPGWCYGLPELSPGQRTAVCASRRIANPGCHATGFLAAVAPLVQQGYILPTARLSCFSLTGYSGGGRKMIARYEAQARTADLESPRLYALPQTHKHLAEMQRFSGLADPPVFSPVVASFYRGMVVTVPLTPEQLAKPAAPTELAEALARHYRNCPLFSVCTAPPDGFLAANALAGKPGVQLYVCGTPERLTVTALFDNLGKGASGAAIQNMNLALRLGEFDGVL